MAGHGGMVGSAIHRRLLMEPDIKVICAARDKLDLRNQTEVDKFISLNKPDEVILAAAVVGGIYANDNYPANFICDNLQIQTNVIKSAHEHGVQKLLFLGSSCIYPRSCHQPMSENDLMSGALEPTNEPYAIAKIAGIKMCESFNRQYSRDYRSIMPTNLYGARDNYHPTNSHVIPALLQRFHDAKKNDVNVVAVWGSGKVRREFLFVDDLADAALFVHNIPYDNYQAYTDTRCSHINIGSGEDITISELACVIKQVVGFEGEIVYDVSKPDGPPRKLLCNKRIRELGWVPKVSLLEGLKIAYKDYCIRINN